jgi:hypothetical protein
LVFLALLTGSSSNLAGITFESREILSRETALTGSALETALAELEKLPTPARSFAVRDGVVIWLRTALEDAPGVFDERDHFVNYRHRTGVKAILGSLPATSVVVQKFKRHYRLALQGPSQGASQGPTQSPKKDRRTDTETENRDQKRITERESREGEPRRLGDLLSRSPAATSTSPAVGAVEVAGNGVLYSYENLVLSKIEQLRPQYPTWTEKQLKGEAEHQINRESRR